MAPFPGFRPRHDPQRSNTRWGVALALLALLAVIVLLWGGWLLEQWERLQNRPSPQERARMLQGYQRNTAPPAQPPELPESFIRARQVEEKLLAHPAVTPGPGFHSPGVQSTGNAIVDAIDQAMPQTAPPATTRQPRP